MYIPRHLARRLHRLVSAFPVVVVTGARQVGKSTLVRQELTDWDMVTLDPSIDVEGAREDPELFLANRPAPLIIDEIQYAPELVAALKRRVDEDRQPGLYVLTGSQQWAVIKSISESLAGRAVFLDLEGFSLGEIAREDEPEPWLHAWLEGPERLAGARRHLDLPYPPWEVLWRGSLPEACIQERDVVPDLLRAYRRSYVERDVRQLADISDWQLFGRFLGLCAALTAQEINHSQLGRELGVSGPTARRWLAILRSTFQWYELPAWSGNAVKRVSGRPKGYIGDTGLACVAQAISTPTTLGGHPLLGALFETSVVGEIRRQSALLPLPPRMFHWRSHGGAEVDLLLERDGVLYPIEIKAKSRPSRRDTRGLAAFRAAHPSATIAPGLLVAPSERTMRLSDEDWAIPWDLAVHPV